MGPGWEWTVQGSVAKQERGLKPIDLSLVLCQLMGHCSSSPRPAWAEAVQSLRCISRAVTPGCCAEQRRSRALLAQHVLPAERAGMGLGAGSWGQPGTPSCKQGPGTALSSRFCCLGWGGKQQACGLCPKKDCRYLCVLVDPGTQMSVS